MKKAYSSPAIRTVGSLEELTQAAFNKIGGASDIFSKLTNNEIAIGSLVPYP